MAKYAFLSSLPDNDMIRCVYPSYIIALIMFECTDSLLLSSFLISAVVAYYYDGGNVLYRLDASVNKLS